MNFPPTRIFRNFVPNFGVGVIFWCPSELKMVGKYIGTWKELLGSPSKAWVIDRLLVIDES